MLHWLREPEGRLEEQGIQGLRKLSGTKTNNFARYPVQATGSIQTCSPHSYLEFNQSRHVRSCNKIAIEIFGLLPGNARMNEGSGIANLAIFDGRKM